MSGFKTIFLSLIFFSISAAQPSLPKNTVYKAVSTQSFFDEVLTYKSLHTEDVLLSINA